MLFAIHDESGKINQANKVYEPAGYDKLLNHLEHKFVAAESVGPRSPDYWFVNVTAKELTERPNMLVTASKTIIKAGGVDSAVLTGIPKDAVVTIAAAGAVLYSMKMDAQELEISIPVPCSYGIMFELWPYKVFRITIEAVA